MAPNRSEYAMLLDDAQWAAASRDFVAKLHATLHALHWATAPAAARAAHELVTYAIVFDAGDLAAACRSLEAAAAQGYGLPDARKRARHEIEQALARFDGSDGPGVTAPACGGAS